MSDETTYLESGSILFKDVFPIPLLGFALLAMPKPATAGIRDLFESSAANTLINAVLQPLAMELLGNPCFPVSAVLFSKGGSRGWGVGWHQDLSVPATPPDQPIAVKGGVPHVQPGVAILDELLAMRLHFDDAGPEHGGLWVVPYSQELGVIPEAKIAGIVAKYGSEPVHATRGSVLAMKPLLLHSSHKPRVKNPRRVLHVLFAPDKLRDYPWARSPAPPD
jgi:ectoine hydroxylase-related dioxygenase (phytanoyl-CoA dioxygenase family)